MVEGRLPDDLAARLLAAHDQALATGDGALKDQARTAVTRVRLDDGQFAVKEYRGGLCERVKEWLRGTRAGLAWRAARRLAAGGIATPEPVAVVLRGDRRYVVSRWVDGATPLHRLLGERFGGPLSQDAVAAKRRMLDGLGRWLRQIHDQGIYHNDWSPKNILAVERGGQWAFYLLDLESVTFYKGLTPRRRIKNLSQLNDARAGVTAADRMRVLVAYAGDDRELTRGAFPRRILAGTLRRAARRTRR